MLARAAPVCWGKPAGLALRIKVHPSGMGAVEAEGSGEKAPSVAVIVAVLVALLAPVVVVFLALSEIGTGPDLFNFVYETKVLRNEFNVH